MNLADGRGMDVIRTLRFAYPRLKVVAYDADSPPPLHFPELNPSAAAAAAQPLDLVKLVQLVCDASSALERPRHRVRRGD